jgi:hypothetical protein
MRIVGIVALGAALVLAACAASRQEVAARLGDQFIGQNVDALVVKFGPPTSTFKLNSGQSSYVWQLTAVTDIAVDRGYGQAQTRFCKVSVIASPVGIITQLNTEDSNAGGQGVRQHMRAAARNEASNLSLGWVAAEGAIFSLATLAQDFEPASPPERANDFEQSDSA